MTDLSFSEFRDGYLALQREIGPRAEIFVQFRTFGDCLSGSIYPYGITKSHRQDGYLQVTADTLQVLLDTMRAEWRKHSAIHDDRIIRKMALAIIRITAELGECTDAALRNCGEFDPGQIKRFGKQACADANDIAGRGPFAIVMRGGANGQPEEDAA